jgi:hypothetical protein
MTFKVPGAIARDLSGKIRGKTRFYNVTLMPTLPQQNTGVTS